ncbi:hypothetical protein BCV70DRAFT_119378 [Testicularia cyperi]|uniref:Uncharacterized protein n=1 Tax=Testicularia cyperi TaxID=1882483 RepID=A0A317XME2_9BASI|nr:hypothetical protein BCV70DRAFT_119378 [Testicularia cyperi]
MLDSAASLAPTPLVPSNATLPLFPLLPSASMYSSLLFFNEPHQHPFVAEHRILDSRGRLTVSAISRSSYCSRLRCLSLLLPPCLGHLHRSRPLVHPPASSPPRQLTSSTPSTATVITTIIIISQNPSASRSLFGITPQSPQLSTSSHRTVPRQQLVSLRSLFTAFVFALS